MAAQKQIQSSGGGSFTISGGEYGSTGVSLSANDFDLSGLGLNTAGLKRFCADRTESSSADRQSGQCLPVVGRSDLCEYRVDASPNVDHFFALAAAALIDPGTESVGVV